MRQVITRLNPYLVVTMLLWGLNFVALKQLLLEVSPLAAALVRSLLMTVLLIGWCRVRGLSPKVPREDWWRVLLQGGLNMGLYMVLFTKGMQGATAAEGAIVLGTAPLWTLALAVVFKQEKFRLTTLIGTLIAFGGVSLVVAASRHSAFGSSGFQSLLLIFAAAAVWACGSIVSRPILTRIDPIVLTTQAMWAGNLVLLPLAWRETLDTNWAHLSPIGWVCLLYFAIAAGAAGFLFFYEGVKRVGAAGAMLYQYFVSPLAAVASWLILGSPLAPLQWVGLLIVLGGVSYANYARSQPQPG